MVVTDRPWREFLPAEKCLAPWFFGFRFVFQVRVTTFGPSQDGTTASRLSYGSRDRDEVAKHWCEMSKSLFDTKQRQSSSML